MKIGLCGLILTLLQYLAIKSKLKPSFALDTRLDFLWFKFVLDSTTKIIKSYSLGQREHRRVVMRSAIAETI